MAKIAVLGAGAWGTALAMQLSHRHQVVLWARNTLHVSALREARANHQYLGDFGFQDSLTIEDCLKTAVNQVDLIISVVPTNGFRAVLQALNGFNNKTPIIWASKGLEAASAKLLYEIAAEELPHTSYGVLSGPSFAGELVRNLPTAVTVASYDSPLGLFASQLIHGGNLRVYSSQDVIGVCVGGAVKNVLAIAAGIADGLQLGSNARAALVTRGLSEMTRFGIALGAQKETFMGLAGLGDLMLTCTGESRNREVGLQLAAGKNLTTITEHLGHVAEGVHTAAEVVKRAAVLGVDMPISKQVHAVLSSECMPKSALQALFSREQKTEFS